MSTARNRALPGPMSEADFAAERSGVLAEWPTGRAIDFDEAVRFHHELPKEKNAARLFSQADKRRVPIIYPRTGEADLQRHLDTLLLLDEEGADLLCTHADSYTRTLRFRDAGSALEESLSTGISLLNGVPVVNYGAPQMRNVVEKTPRPNQYRQGTPNGRLASEVVLAAGYQSILGGIIGSIPHMRDHSIGECIHNWQYVDRLVGVYEEAGVTIHREYYGALMGMVMPPSLMCASLVFDALLAAEQGVRHLSLGVNNNLHLRQDVATLRVLRKLTRDYLDRYSFTEVEVTPVLHMWMGAFPQEQARAYALITLGAFTAVYGQAASVIVKTADEAFGTPTAEANAIATRLTRAVVEIAAGQVYPDSHRLSEEESLIEQETRSIVETALELGRERFGPSVEEAFATGIIDIPLAPATCNEGKAMAVRDAEGAVRFYNTGKLPFSDDVKDFHRQKIAERAALEGMPVNYKMVVRDISMKAFESRVLEGLEHA